MIAQIESREKSSDQVFSSSRKNKKDKKSKATSYPLVSGMIAKLKRQVKSSYKLFSFPGERLHNKKDEKSQTTSSSYRQQDDCKTKKTIKSLATSSSLPQWDDCKTRKTRNVKLQALLYPSGMIAQLERQESQATSSPFPSGMIAQLERQEKSNDQLFSSPAG